METLYGSSGDGVGIVWMPSSKVILATWLRTCICSQNQESFRHFLLLLYSPTWSLPRFGHQFPLSIEMLRVTPTNWRRCRWIWAVIKGLSRFNLDFSGYFLHSSCLLYCLIQFVCYRCSLSHSPIFSQSCLRCRFHWSSIGEFTQWPMERSIYPSFTIALPVSLGEVAEGTLDVSLLLIIGSKGHATAGFFVKISTFVQTFPWSLGSRISHEDRYVLFPPSISVCVSFMCNPLDESEAWT